MKKQMKKILLLALVTVIALSISVTYSVKKEVTRIQNEFTEKMISCTPETSDDGKVIVHGTKDGTCHISFIGQSFTDPKTKEVIKLDNCYFPIKEDGNIKMDFKYCK